MEAAQLSPGKSEEEPPIAPKTSVPGDFSPEKDADGSRTSFQASQIQTEATDPPGEKRSSGSNSSMTTKELQEYWRDEKSKSRQVKVLFEIPSAKIVDKPFSKYVVYQIIIVQTGSFDSNRSVIERRYSDFERLHTCLVKEFYDEMDGVTFPKKSLTRNFAEDFILERKLAFEDYLRLLYSMEDVRTSRLFIDFLVRPELEEAYACLRGGQYVKALQLFLGVVGLQEKLTSHRPVLVVPTLCAILVCHRDLENARCAYEFGEKALLRLENHPRHRYYVPLLETMAALAYDLDKGFLPFQEEIEKRKDQKHHQHKMVTLKELAVQEHVR